MASEAADPSSDSADDANQAALASTPVEGQLPEADAVEARTDVPNDFDAGAAGQEASHASADKHEAAETLRQRLVAKLGWLKQRAALVEEAQLAATESGSSLQRSASESQVTIAASFDAARSAISALEQEACDAVQKQENETLGAVAAQEHTLRELQGRLSERLVCSSRVLTEMNPDSFFAHSFVFRNEITLASGMNHTQRFVAELPKQRAAQLRASKVRRAGGVGGELWRYTDQAASHISKTGTLNQERRYIRVSASAWRRSLLAGAVGSVVEFTCGPLGVRLAVWRQRCVQSRACEAVLRAGLASTSTLQMHAAMRSWEEAWRLELKAQAEQAAGALMAMSPEERAASLAAMSLEEKASVIRAMPAGHNTSTLDEEGLGGRAMHVGAQGHQAGGAVSAEQAAVLVNMSVGGRRDMLATMSPQQKFAALCAITTLSQLESIHTPQNTATTPAGVPITPNNTLNHAQSIEQGGEVRAEAGSDVPAATATPGEQPSVVRAMPTNGNPSVAEEEEGEAGDEKKQGPLAATTQEGQASVIRAMPTNGNPPIQTGRVVDQQVQHNACSTQTTRMLETPLLRAVIANCLHVYSHARLSGLILIWALRCAWQKASRLETMIPILRDQLKHRSESQQQATSDAEQSYMCDVRAITAVTQRLLRQLKTCAASLIAAWYARQAQLWMLGLVAAWRMNCLDSMLRNALAGVHVGHSHRIDQPGSSIVESIAQKLGFLGDAQPSAPLNGAREGSACSEHPTRETHSIHPLVPNSSTQGIRTEPGDPESEVAYLGQAVKELSSELQRSQKEITLVDSDRRRKLLSARAAVNCAMKRADEASMMATSLELKLSMQIQDSLLGVASSALLQHKLSEERRQMAVIFDTQRAALQSSLDAKTGQIELQRRHLAESSLDLQEARQRADGLLRQTQALSISDATQQAMIQSLQAALQQHELNQRDTSETFQTSARQVLELSASADVLASKMQRTALKHLTRLAAPNLLVCVSSWKSRALGSASARRRAMLALSRWLNQAKYRSFQTCVDTMRQGVEASRMGCGGSLSSAVSVEAKKLARLLRESGNSNGAKEAEDMARQLQRAAYA